MGTTDAGFRQGMAGGSRGITVPEHAGQVPTPHRYHTKEQYHNTLRHSQRVEDQEARDHR